MYSISIFLFYILLVWEGAYGPNAPPPCTPAPPTHPPAYGPVIKHADRLTRTDTQTHRPRYICSNGPPHMALVPDVASWPNSNDHSVAFCCVRWLRDCEC